MSAVCLALGTAQSPLKGIAPLCLCALTAVDLRPNRGHFCILLHLWEQGGLVTILTLKGRKTGSRADHVLCYFQERLAPGCQVF